METKNGKRKRNYLLNIFFEKDDRGTMSLFVVLCFLFVLLLSSGLVFLVCI